MSCVAAIDEQPYYINCSPGVVQRASLVLVRDSESNKISTLSESKHSTSEFDYVNCFDNLGKLC